jgi:LysM repeat protein
VDRICPFLALGDDHRSAVDGFDPDHQCRAVSPSIPVDRATQGGLCLHEGHAECARFKAAAALRGARRASPRPAPDATFASTRLILDVEPAWRGVGLTSGSLQRPGRVALTGASVLVLLGTAAAAASTNGFGLLPVASLPTQQPTPSHVATPTATIAPTPTPIPTPSPSVAASATPRPATPAPTANPTPRTYVVRPGDSLSSIAAAFGVSVQQLTAANQLTNPNQLSIGQVLIIP